MATPYSEVFTAFKNKITDPFYSELNVDNATEDMILLLNDAILDFSYPKSNIHDRDDKLMTFNVDLKYDEIQILSILMNLKWIQRQLSSIYNLQQVMQTKDFTIYSQANHLNTLLALEENVKNRASNAMKRFGIKSDYNTADLSGMAGDY